MKKTSPLKDPLTDESMGLGRRGTELKGLKIEDKLMEQTMTGFGINYRTLLDNSNDGIFVLNDKGYFVLVNGVIEQRSGIPLDKWVGSHYLDFLKGKDSERAQLNFEKAIRGEDVPPYEMEYRSSDGRKLCVELNTKPIFRGGKIIGILGISRDISMRKQLEKKLRESEKNFRALARNANDCILVVAGEGEHVYANERASELTDYSIDELMKMGIRELVPPEDFEMIEENYKKSLKGKYVPTHYETAIIRKDGMIVPVDVTGGRTLWQGKPAVIAITRDISDRKRKEEELRKARENLERRVKEATTELVRSRKELELRLIENEKVMKNLLVHQKRLRSLASELSLTEERERRRFAMFLHDHIGSSLAIAKIKLEDLGKSYSSPGIAVDSDEISKIITSVIQDIRYMTFDLSPPILYELGFEEAVEWLAEQLDGKNGLSCNFENDNQSKPLSEDVRTLLFQSVRELLLNITKHANASNVNISSRRDGKNIRIIIEDDGVGFDTSKLDPFLERSDGFGLFSIRERFDSIGGYMEIKSQISKGTRVTLVAHLKLTERAT